jgi:hypothetical protein
MNNNDNKLSVAIWMVTFNHQEYIKAAIDSVLMQKTNFKYKLFIGEDNSTDRTRDICCDFKNLYPEKIELIINETNLGAIKNGRQIYYKCIESGAKYIAILEGDDYWTDPNKLQKQVDFMESNLGVSVCFHDYMLLNGSYLTYSKLDINNSRPVDLPSFYFNSFKDSNFWISQPLTAVFRVSSLDPKIFDLYKNFKDYHLFYHLFQVGKGYYISEVMGVYRQNQLGVFTSSSKLSRMKEDYEIKQEIYIINNDLTYKSYYEGAAALYIIELLKSEPKKIFIFFKILYECASISLLSSVLVILKSIYYSIKIKHN